MPELSPQAIVYRSIAERRSIRRYLADTVPEDTLQHLLAAATAAPSSHNRQPWRFVVLRDAAAKADLAEAMGRRLWEDRSPTAIIYIEELV